MHPTRPSLRAAADRHEAHAPGGWTSGFWPGLMWQLFNASVPSDQDDPSAWATQAQAWAAAMSPHQHDVRDALHLLGRLR